MHNTAHAQDSNSERACGGAEILTHLLLDVKETAQKYQSILNGRYFYRLRQRYRLFQNSRRKRMASLFESFEESWSESREPLLSSLGLLDLPTEILALILRYLPLFDLANTRLVSPIIFKQFQHVKLPLISTSMHSGSWKACAVCKHLSTVRLRNQAARCGRYEEGWRAYFHLQLAQEPCTFTSHKSH